MTEAQQRRFYFPAWNDCAVANGWIMKKGRIQNPGDRSQYETWSEPARSLALKVITIAEQLAGRDHSAVVPDHLRHGCNFVASEGRTIRSADLTNKETNRAVNLFRLLRDPDDLEAVMNWENPDNADRQSYVVFLKKQFNEATIIAISRNAFGTAHWEELPIEKLRWIAKQGRNRRPSRKVFYRQQLADVEDKNPF